MQRHRIVAAWIFISLLSAMFFNHAVRAQTTPPAGDITSISASDIVQWFPDALIENAVIEPGYRRVFVQGKLAGAIFLTDRINPIPAYSGRPVAVLGAIDRNGRIVGVRIHHHEEPILVIGVDTSDLERFTQQFSGLLANQPIRVGMTAADNGVDGITGATITSMVVARSIATSAQAVNASLLATDIAAAEHSLATTDTSERWESWGQRKVAIATMGTALIALLSILFFQDWLVKRPTLYRRIRIGYLLFTAVVIGGVFSAQLSIVNLFAFLQNVSSGFSWSTLLIDPVIFLLWTFVAVSLLLWGRGVFCGWLCPFGAIQELIHMAARKFELPSFAPPHFVHERLWAIKYFMLIGLFGVSLESFGTMSALVEVEPFKTVALNFDRPWYFVLYAAVLLVAAAFTGKFYCKYLCVLGAGLSIFGRLRIFDWLHRRNQCGNPCQSCANLCPIGAIKETGEIISHECHYCMECQVAYWDKNFCQALLPRQKRQRGSEGSTETEVKIISIERNTQ